MSLHHVAKRPRVDSDYQMDLLTLPDEMLASILKYTNFEESQKIRKLNRRANEVFMSYNIRTLELNEIMFWRPLAVDFTSALEMKVEIFGRNDVVLLEKTLLTKNAQHYLQLLLEFIFKKVKSIDEFSVISCLNEKLILDEDALGKFSKLFRKRITFFTISGLDLQFGSSQNFEKFLQTGKFEKLEARSTFSTDQTLSDEMIEGLSFKSLIWCQPSHITSKWLHKMCEISLPEELRIHSKYITIKDIAQILEAFGKNDVSHGLETSQGQYMEWKFHEIEKESMSTDEIKKCFENSKLYKSIEVTEDRETGSITVILKTFTWRDACSYDIRLKFCPY